MGGFDSSAEGVLSLEDLDDDEDEDEDEELEGDIVDEVVPAEGEPKKE